MHDGALVAQVSGEVRSTVGMIVVSTLLPKIFKTIFAQDWEDEDANCVLRNFNKLTWCVYFVIIAVEIACCAIIRYDPNAWAEALKWAAINAICIPNPRNPQDESAVEGGRKACTAPFGSKTAYNTPCGTNASV